MEPAQNPQVKFLLYVALAAGAGALVATIVGTFGYNFFQTYQASRAEIRASEAYGEAYTESSSCNVLGIQIHGNIVGSRSEIPISDIMQSSDGSGSMYTPNYTIAGDIVYYLMSAASDPSIKAVLLDIDSPGGDGESGEEIAQAINDLGKPSVAVIHGLGLSAAYWAASAADQIYAYKTSTVGSIGATYSFLNQSEKNAKEGVKYEVLSSGPYKDMFSPDKPLTSAEKALIERDLKVIHDNFVTEIALNRTIDREDVAALADGSSLIALTALELGLVDALTGNTGAARYLEEKIGEPITYCWQ